MRRLREAAALLFEAAVLAPERGDDWDWTSRSEEVRVSAELMRAVIRRDFGYAEARRREQPPIRELADHGFEQGAEHDEVVGVGGFIHLAVGHAASARPHRDDREPQRAEDFVPVQILG